MSPIDNHTELQEMLPEVSLDMLEPADTERVTAHVGDCPECTTQLQEYRDAAAVLAFELTGRRLNVQRAGAIRARLLARARADGAMSISRKASKMVYQWSGWMVAAGLTGVLLVHHSVHRPLDYGWLAAGILVVVSLGLGVYAWAQRSRIAELEDHVGSPRPRDR